MTVPAAAAGGGTSPKPVLDVGAEGGVTPDRAQTPSAPASDEAHSRAAALVIVQAGLGVGSRHFAYTDRITASLRPYDLFAAPLASLQAEIYPLARTRVPFVSGFGVTGYYARALALSSADAGGQKVGTSWQSYGFGARERFAVTPNVLLGVNAGYGAVDFKFDTPSFNNAELPSVGYRFVRIGPDARFSFGSASVGLGGDYLVMLSTGDMAALFPRESVGGFDARLTGAYRFGQNVELSLGVEYTRFFYSMNPVPGDANVAGGALDELAGLSLGLAYLW